jgi:hypothetical protein
VGLLRELDFDNNDALENAALNVDIPRCPGILGEAVSPKFGLHRPSRASSRRRRSGSHSWQWAL